jgi:hypothetical protein
MKTKGKSFIILHAVEVLYSLIVFAWVFAPLLVQGLMPTLSLPFHAFGGEARSIFGLVCWSLVVFLPLLIALFKVAAIFLDDVVPTLADPHRPFSAALSVIQSVLVIAGIVAYIIEFARVARFFSASSPLIYVLLVLSVGFNAFFIYLLISSLDTRDESYREYRHYKDTNEARKGIRELLFNPGIQKRLVFSFVPLILVIIVVLSFILMTDFANTILGSVIDNGKLLAERTATVIKSNPTDKIAAEDYLLIEAKRNASAAFPFHDISSCARNPKNNA